MRIKLITHIVSAIIGFIVSFFISKSILYHPKSEIDTGDKVVNVKLVTKIDTIYMPKVILKHDSIVRPTIVRVDTVFMKGKIPATIPEINRVYKDVSKIDDSVEVSYIADVTGTLNRIDLSYKNTKSIMVIKQRDSMIVNTIVKKPVRGVFLSLDGGYRTFSPGLQYVTDKNIIGAKYNILTDNSRPINNIQVSYSRKLF